MAVQPPDYLVLRDGTTAQIRIAGPNDVVAMQAFVDRLSPEARHHRFFSESAPPAEVITSLCDSSNPRARLTLIVMRTREGLRRIVATGSYFAIDEQTAEVALAVEDAFQGKGLGTLLLERLALEAARYGFKRLQAVTHTDNRAMREVVHESGFQIHETLEGGEMGIELSLQRGETGGERSEIRRRLATVASLRPFFYPRAVAVIGASRDLLSIGHRVLAELVRADFKGPVFPVNPNAAIVGAMRAYTSIKDIPEPVDLAVIVVPHEVVLEVVDRCAEQGVKALIVVSAGFAETGPEGRDLQNRLVEKVRQYGMRLIGPNCLGVINTDPAVSLNASFSPIFPRPGCIAMMSQSGALGLAVLATATQRGLGLSSFVSVGNKADVSTNDLLLYWEEDERTQVILLYVESFGNPRRFARIARRVGRRKPIVAVKAGRTIAGRRAAGSHTAAIASNDVGVDALFHQSGVLRAETLEDMLALGQALARQPLPPGRRVAIISNAGGPATLCADACEAGGLSVPELSETVRDRLAATLPRTASLKNPIDLIASATPEQYRLVVEAALKAPEVDALIVLYTSVGGATSSAIAGGICEGVRAGRADGAHAKPVIACWLGEEDAGVSELLEQEAIPAYAFPETAARVLSKMAQYREWLASPEGTVPHFSDMQLTAVRNLCRQVLSERGAGWLSADEVRSVLEAACLPVPPGGVARTPEAAAALAQHIGFPVAVKLASRRIVHKTDLGVIHLNLMDERMVRNAVTAIRDRLSREGLQDAMEGVLVQPMFRDGVEVMAGVTHDPVFGPLIGFGLGGIHVEVLGDVRFRVTPLTDRDAAEMVREIRGYRLLEGYRGHPPADVKAIEELLLRLSHLVEEVEEITELDLNPILALAPEQGCRVLDARIRVEPVERGLTVTAR